MATSLWLPASTDVFSSLFAFFFHLEFLRRPVLQRRASWMCTGVWAATSASFHGQFSSIFLLKLGGISPRRLSARVMHICDFQEECVCLLLLCILRVQCLLHKQTWLLSDAGVSILLMPYCKFNSCCNAIARRSSDCVPGRSLPKAQLQSFLKILLSQQL